MAPEQRRHASLLPANVRLAYQAGKEAAEERKLVGMVRYETNVLGTRGPRKMTVLVPRPEGGADSLPDGGSMTQRRAPLTASHACRACKQVQPGIDSAAMWLAGCSRGGWSRRL